MTRSYGGDILVPDRAPLPGEGTLLGSWAALAAQSPGARLLDTGAAWAAVFPRWAPLNNAILRGRPTPAALRQAVGDLRHLYSAANVHGWALWFASRATSLTAVDAVANVPGMTRDTTTLVMTADLADDAPTHPAVIRTSIDAANRAGEEPIPADLLPTPDERADIDGWVLVHEGLAVTGAWAYVDGSDVGIYAVGTAPDFRRRGLARALMLHVLADARHRRARTATLQSTAMGQPLYESLGFRAVGRYEEWVPAVPAPASPITPSLKES